MPPSSTRTETNRANAQHSTGPRTAAGKQRSSQNAFQHGLYSKQLILPGECAAEFDRLRATLRSEHQPAHTTEEILVDELAQHFWRMRRFREIEARAWHPDNLNDWLTTGLLALIARSLASAERAFFRTLAALTKLQKARGFVPQRLPAATDQACSDATEANEDHLDFGFVPPNPTASEGSGAAKHADTPGSAPRWSRRPSGNLGTATIQIP